MSEVLVGVYVVINGDYVSLTIVSDNMEEFSWLPWIPVEEEIPSLFIVEATEGFSGTDIGVLYIDPRAPHSTINLCSPVYTSWIAAEIGSSFTYHAKIRHSNPNPAAAVLDLQLMPTVA